MTVKLLVMLATDREEIIPRERDLRIIDRLLVDRYDVMDDLSRDLLSLLQTDLAQHPDGSEICFSRVLPVSGLVKSLSELLHAFLLPDLRSAPQTLPICEL